MKIELIDVYCRDTEDVTGADEFYLVGALVGGTVRKAILTKPIDINDNQRKTFPADQTVLFEGEVPQGQSVKGGIKAYDEDAAKDWAKYSSTVNAISAAVAAGIALTGPQGATAGAILTIATQGIGLLAESDKDDLLGSTLLEISTTGPAFEERSWLMKEGGLGWSTWDYTVRYRIQRS
jgi:hypothetical protein